MSEHVPGPTVDGPLDPEHHPSASYILEPDDVRALTRRIVATSGTSKEVRSPLDDAPLAHIPQSSEADVAEAFERARVVQARWARTPVEEREQALLRLHDLILQRQEDIIDLLVLETGKARKHAFDEVLHLALTARYYGRTAHQHLASERRPGVIPLLTRVDVNHHPKGVVGVISPWNYPLTMAMCDGLAALAAGNAVVAKPDHQTMLIALLGVELLEDAGFPDGLWQVVAGDGPTIGGAIVQHADYVCFTGSTNTGRLIARGCAERLIGCSLELGGKNPMVVLGDASIEKASEGAVRAAFSNSGQLCISIERMYVDAKIYDRFVNRFVARTEAMTLGATIDWENDMGPLISQAQLGRVLAHLDDAVSKGARVLTGGRHRPDLAPYYVEPTILEGVTPEMSLYGKETFGPVVSLYKVHDDDEAVARANDGEYGLNASVYGRGARARSVASRIKAGSVNVNEAFAATIGSLAAPMGGMRDSGLGRRQGPEGILRFTEAQSVASQRLMAIAPSFGLSDERYAALMTASLKMLKRLGRA
jgi:succinate-semialdehyde dehydrogenase/glutarate-semialdehyde dehydrogenase